jgi:hypothetical protein
MLLRARLTLAASMLFAGGTIWFVHWNQINEREVRRNRSPARAAPNIMTLGPSDLAQRRSQRRETCRGEESTAGGAVSYFSSEAGTIRGRSKSAEVRFIEPFRSEAHVEYLPRSCDPNRSHPRILIVGWPIHYWDSLFAPYSPSLFSVDYESFNQQKVIYCASNYSIWHSLLEGLILNGWRSQPGQSCSAC